MQILVTSTRAVATLDLIRLLAKRGYSIFGAETFTSAIANQSRYLEGFDLVSSPKYNEKQYIEDLLSIIQRRKIGLLIPTCEEVFYIAKYKQILSAHCNVFCSSLGLLNKLHNKWTFSELLNDIDVTAPKSFLITNNAYLENYMNTSHGFVFKPVYSRFASNTLIRPSAGDLANIDFSLGSWLAQTYIDGQEICSYNIAHHGKLSLHSCYANKYRAGQGAGIYFHARNNDKILAFVERFVAQHNFHGQISFDFIVDQNEKIYVIECNPRLTSGLHLFREQIETVDHILNYKNQLLIPRSKKYYMLTIPFLAYGIIDVIKQRVTLKNFIHDLFHATCVIYDSKDRTPFFKQFFSLVNFIYKSIRNKISIQEATTDEIEWNG